jgi:aspartate/methionine/tyrosine aminotransferase
MYALNNLFAASPAHPSEILSVAVFQSLSILRNRARAIVEADRAALTAFLDTHDTVDAVRTQFGSTSFLRLKNGNVDEFLARLRSEYETSAVPGRFFDAPGHFRIGMGVDHAMFVEGLRRLGLALNE